MSESLQECIARHGLSIRAEFVPFSRSRNAKPDAMPSERSLNWRVTLVFNNPAYGVARQGDILTTDYSAGIGHCPSYKQGMRMTLDNAALIKFETEQGRTACRRFGTYSTISPGKPILPKDADVIYSLVSDSDVLNYGKFAEWASEFGYDEDSRKAESIYRARLEIALTLRAGIGETMLAELREAASEY